MANNTAQDRTLLAGLSRLRRGLQKAIEWFSGGVSTGPAGSATKVELGTNLTATQVGNTLTIDASGGGGTVSSVAVSTGSSGVSVTGSPVTTSGTIDLDLGTLAAVDDAPSDGTTYGRNNGTWVAAGGGGSASNIFAVIGRGLGTLQAGDARTLNSAPACTITGGSITSRVTGSVSIDVRVSSDYTVEPGPGDSIIGNSLYNIILSAEKSHVIDVTNWATDTLTAGQRLDFYVVSASGVKDVTIQLNIS